MIPQKASKPCSQTQPLPITPQNLRLPTVALHKPSKPSKIPQKRPLFSVPFSLAIILTCLLVPILAETEEKPCQDSPKFICGDCSVIKTSQNPLGSNIKKVWCEKCRNDLHSTAQKTNFGDETTKIDFRSSCVDKSTFMIYMIVGVILMLIILALTGFAIYWFFFRKKKASNQNRENRYNMNGDGDPNQFQRQPWMVNGYPNHSVPLQQINMNTPQNQFISPQAPVPKPFEAYQPNPTPTSQRETNPLIDSKPSAK